MANEDEEVIIDNRIEVLADALTNPDVDIENIETHSDLEALMKRAVIAIRNAQASSSTGSVWGQITGNLADQTDLTRALSGKASVSDLAAIDTRTRTLENTITTKADQSALDAKANTVDVNAALDLKADTSYVTQMLATKASKDEVDAKANKSDVELMFTQLMPVINEKAVAKMWSNIEVPASGWSSSAPYTQTVTVNGMLETYNPEVDIKFTDNTTIETEESYYSCVKRITTGANSITLICPSEKPAGTFHIKLKEVS